MRRVSGEYGSGYRGNITRRCDRKKGNKRTETGPKKKEEEKLNGFLKYFCKLGRCLSVKIGICLFVFVGNEEIEFCRKIKKYGFVRNDDKNIFLFLRSGFVGCMPENS